MAEESKKFDPEETVAPPSAALDPEATITQPLAALDPENLIRCLKCVLERAQTLIVIAHP